MVKDALTLKSRREGNMRTEAVSRVTLFGAMPRVLLIVECMISNMTGVSWLTV